MRRFLSDVRIGIATAGARGFVDRVREGLFGRFFARVHLMVIEQDLHAVRENAAPDGIIVEEFSGNWVTAEGLLTARMRERFTRRSEAGRRCIVARRDGHIVGYTWISGTIDPGIEELPLALPDGAAYLWDLFVPVTERGTGIGSALTSARMNVAASLGFSVGWRAISPANRPSVRTAEKTGDIRVLGEIRIRKSFGRRRYSEERFEDRPLLAEGAFSP